MTSKGISACLSGISIWSHKSYRRNLTNCMKWSNGFSNFQWISLKYMYVLYVSVYIYICIRT